MAIPINIEDLLNKRKIESNRIDAQEVDGKSVLVIWAPAGVNRPYNVRERVTAKQSPSKWYVRNGTSTIEAYQAIEEAVVNALYHRDYQEREPVEITIEPKKISILSYVGPDRSISLDAIHKAEHLKSRRYRNRRLGDYLKELQLSEGRATGIPTIQDELCRNGSEPARIETDEDRTYFLIEIPCREGFENTSEPLNESLNEPLNDKEMLILREISNRQPINRKLLTQFTGIPASTVTRIISKLSTDPLALIERQGAKKDGGYILTEKGSAFLMRKHHINENV